MSPDIVWEVPQTRDTIDPKSSHYNPLSAYAKTLRRDGKTWGSVPAAVACCANAATSARLVVTHCLPGKSRLPPVGMIAYLSWIYG